MKRIALVSLFAVAVTGLANPVMAQQAPAAKLNAIQALGQMVYTQHCGVCHTKPTILSPYYGPPLSKEIVNNNESVLRDFIHNGTDRMPGFQYTLEPCQIDAVIQYLKTVMPPADSTTPESPVGRGNEREVD
jgi:mono/diheme cytochrome c family protein